MPARSKPRERSKPKAKAKPRTVAKARFLGMTIEGTPVEFYKEFGLFVKREDLCCPQGPHFSKCRGVFAHVASRPERIIGVLDTLHSQGGWATARACKLLKKQCTLYYPVRKHQAEAPLQPQQEEARELGADLVKLKAGRSAILYHQAKAAVTAVGGYMMPNALKLQESVIETAAEVQRTKLPKVDTIIVPASSATIAAGVLLGLSRKGWTGTFIVHLGYTRSIAQVKSYMTKVSGVATSGVDVVVLVVDEGYDYADQAKPGPDAPFESNSYYDLKSFRWWAAEGREKYGKALLWNIG